MQINFINFSKYIKNRGLFLKLLNTYNVVENINGGVVMTNNNTPKKNSLITKAMERDIMVALVKSVLNKGLISDEIYRKMLVKINQS